MILESIVTSVSNEGIVNLAPMGPTVDRAISTITLRPFRSSRTYANLQQTGRAVVHITDDALLFARAAVDDIEAEEVHTLITPVVTQNFWRLKNCHRWFAIEVASSTEDDLRATMQCRIIESGTAGTFFGFNRAKHAIIEAAILATRVHLIDPDQIHRKLDHLRVLVDKTAGEAEHEAFSFLTRTIADRIVARA